MQKQRAGYRSRNAPKVTKDVVVEQAMLDKGKLITDVRNSNDMCEAVRDRLCLWPTGDEVITLLMMLKSDQICKSYRPSAVVPKPLRSPIVVNFNDDEKLLSRKSSLSGRDSMIEDRISLPSSRSNRMSKRASSVVQDLRQQMGSGSRTRISSSQRGMSMDERSSQMLAVPSQRSTKMSRTSGIKLTDAKSIARQKMNVIEELD